MTVTVPDRSTKDSPVQNFKVVVADPLPDEGVEALRAIGEVVVAQKWTTEKLKEELANADALLVRSATKVTADLIKAAPRLKIVGRAGVGVDNVDVPACTARGILVVNSPEGNTVSAAEHTVALILSMVRHIPSAQASFQAGEWKRNQFVGTELYKKTIGIVGLGKIGREVAARLSNFRARILAYDPFLSEQMAREINVELADLNTVLEQSDIITIHTPLTKETQNLIGAAQLQRMKKGSRLVNCARGGLVDETALYEALKSGHLASAAVDVFAEEPPPRDLPLLSLKNVVVTPHLGASTEEAQMRVSVDVVEQVIDVLQGRPARSPVNFPSLPADQMAALQPFLALGEKMGLLQAQLIEGAVRSVEITYSGEVARLKVEAVTSAVLKGLLGFGMSDRVNYVNAPFVAQERGIRVVESKAYDSGHYVNLVRVKVSSDQDLKTCEGTLFGKKEPRVVSMDDYPIEFVPEGYKLLTWQLDVPGVVGRVGTMLGAMNINIAEMQAGRQKMRGKAVMILSVDSVLTEKQIDEIKTLEGIADARLAIL